MAIGSVEVIFGAALLVTVLAPYAAAVLGVIMVGAAYTHLAAGELGMTFMPLMFLGLLFLVGWARRPEWLRKHGEEYKLPNGGQSQG